MKTRLERLLVISVVILMVIIACFMLSGCEGGLPVRVVDNQKPILTAPTGKSVGSDGVVQEHNPSLPQPRKETYQSPPPSDLSWINSIVQLVGIALPGPWGPILTALGGTLVGIIGGRRSVENGTVANMTEGIEELKKDDPQAYEAVTKKLSKTMDKNDKAVVRRVKP